MASALVLANPVSVFGQDTATINSAPSQTIKGWGCYPSYFNSAIPNNADVIFDKPAIQNAIYGMGITHIRVSVESRLYVSGTTVSNIVLDPASVSDLVEQIQVARNHGVNNYIMSCWSPPAVWKDGGTVNGGHLIAADEPYYVAYYIKVIQTLQAAGVGLPMAVSVQNEPDISTGYDSCIYTDSGAGYALWRQLIQDMSAALIANGMSSVAVIGPEASNTDNDINLLGASPNFAMLANSSFKAALGAYASHTYGENIWLGMRGGIRSYPKDAWITEWSVDSNSNDGGTESGWTLETMAHMASNLVDIPYNYWTWWAAWNEASAPQGTTLIAGTQTPVYSERYWIIQRLWTTVRPGWVVHSMTCNDTNYITSNSKQNTFETFVDLVSFWNPTGNACVTMLINKTSSTTTMAVSGLVGSNYLAFQSDATHDMVNVGGGVVANGSATVSLAPSSVTLLMTSSVVQPAVTGLATAVSTSGVTLTWPISYGATSYNIKRATSSSGPFTTIGTTGTALTFTDTTAVAGTTYYYVVTAVNPSGESANSNAASIAVPYTSVAVADTYVQDGGEAKDNYGSATFMDVKLGPSGYTREAFLRFNVSGLANAQSVQVLLVPTSVGTNVYASNPLVFEWVANDTWNESTMTWNTKPTGSGINFTTSATGYYVGVPVAIDVTAQAKAQASADGLLSVHVYSTFNDLTGNYWAEFGTKENASPAYQPVLAYTFPTASNVTTDGGTTDTPTLPQWALILLTTGLFLTASTRRRVVLDR